MLAAVGLSMDYLRSGFLTLRPAANGFNVEEDLDLSLKVHLGVWLAPSNMGYVRTGVGPEAQLWVGTGGPRYYARGAFRTNGLFTSAGLDSGRVDVEASFGARIFREHWDLLYLTLGAQENPPPGGEYDLGAGSASAAASANQQVVSFFGPRLFDPHAFTGTRTIWGTYEHRWFAFDNVLNLLGIGFAAFLDYGGAWYPDQEVRLGGDVGLGLRIGSIRSSIVGLSRIDIGYKFGDGSGGGDIVVAFGGAFRY